MVTTGGVPESLLYITMVDSTSEPTEFVPVISNVFSPNFKTILLSNRSVAALYVKFEFAIPSCLKTIFSLPFT